MADIKSAAARRVLPATLTHVDHRHPICDQYCRCRRCKPPRSRRQPRGRAFLAGFALLLAFWSIALCAALGTLA